MGRRAAPSQRMAAAVAHAASRAVVPAAEFGGQGLKSSLPSAPEWAAPTWWPDEGEEYLISVAADTFDGDWEWVQSPKKPPLPRSSDSEMPAGQDSEPEASAPQETLTLFLENVSGENDLAELYRITCKAPPAKVNKLLAAVCVALRVPPQPSASNHRGSYFAAGRALLRDSTDLLFRLSSFNPEELLVDGERRRKIKKAIKSLSVPSVKKVCSSAGGLAQWLHTIDARTDAAEQRATALRTNAAASRSGHTKLPGPGDTAAGNARTRHAGAHYGLESGPPWSPWDDETSDTGKSRLHKTSDDYCGWAIDTPAGRRQPPARYSVSGAKDAARQTQTEVLGVDVPAISVSRADYQRHPPAADPRPKPPLDLTLLHSGSPADHTFRGTTEFRDGLCGPGSAAWAAETGRPAGLPLLTRGALGVQILGGGFHELIPGGAEVPAEASKRFSLSHADQREVCIVVLEAAGEPAGQPIPASSALGEGVPQSTKLLAMLDLVGLPATTPASMTSGSSRPPTIEVAFYLSTEAKLTVAVRDLRSGRQQRWSE